MEAVRGWWCPLLRRTVNKRVRACASMGTGADAAQTWHACAEYRPRAGRLMRTVTRHTQTGCVCWCTLLWQKLWLGRWQKGLDGGRSFPTSGNDWGPGIQPCRPSSEWRWQRRWLRRWRTRARRHQQQVSAGMVFVAGRA